MRSPLVLLVLGLLACADDEPSPVPDGGDGSVPDGGAGHQTDDGGVSVDCQTCVAPRVDNDTQADFFAQPWPLVTRLSDRGTLDLTGFPFPPESTFVGDNIDIVEDNTGGFGTNQGIHLAFTGGIDPDTLPLDGRASLEEDSSVYLVNMDPESTEEGKRLPILCNFQVEPTGYGPANLLTCVPMPGFPMGGDTRYGLVVTSTVTEASGRPLEVSPRWRSLRDQNGDNGEVADRLIDAFAPYFDHLAATGTDPERVVAGTLFRTQDPVAGMRALADHIRSQDPPDLTAGSLVSFAGALPSESGNYDALRGEYMGPIYQQGDTPYRTSGGNIRFDGSGVPLVSTHLPLQFGLSLPNQVDMPAAGWPVVLYHHGTGGDAFSFMADGTAFHLAAAQVAAIGIDAPVHGTRRPDGEDPQLLFFNIQNALALRDNIRQGAADLLVLKRFVEQLNVAAAVSPTAEAIRFNPDQIYFMGHSQGGVTGPLMLAVDDSIKGAMLSGAGGAIVTSILHKRSPLDIPAAARALLAVQPEEPFDIFHPFLSVVQAFTEPADTSNYVPFLYRWAGGRGMDVWVTQGMDDEDVPKVITDALVGALGVQPLAPLVEDVVALNMRGLDSLSAPITGNIEAQDGTRHTGVYSQYPGLGHFLIQQDPGAEAQLTHWFDSLRRTGSAELIAAP